jgi:hypothetical protein
MGFTVTYRVILPEVLMMLFESVIATSYIKIYNFYLSKLFNNNEVTI